MIHRLLALAAVAMVIFTPLVVWSLSYLDDVRLNGAPSLEGSPITTVLRTTIVETQPRPAQQIDISEVDVTLTANGSFLMTDGNGRSVGRDAKTAKEFSDIPRSTYFEDRVGGEASRYAQLDRPQTGTYRIVVTGVRDGPYVLSVRIFSIDGSSQAPLTAKGSLKAGIDETFSLNLESSREGKSSLTRISTQRK